MQHTSAFGERTIYNSKGEIIFRSLIGNPWGYKEKRFDEETRLINFGLRLYDPETHRWTTRDPLGSLDDPNLYAFLHNNPLTHIDRLGLATEDSSQNSAFRDYFYGNDVELYGEVEGRCVCAQDRDCRRGGDIGSALGGISHGVVDFFVGSLHDLQTMMVYMGSNEMGMTLQERVLMIDAVARSQANQMAAIEGWMMNTLSIDESNAVYRSFRSKTTMGLEVGSLVTGGYGAVKGVIAFNRLAKMPGQITKISKGLGTRLPKTILVNSKSWINSINPFKGKTFQEIDQLLRAKGFTIKGPDPLHGRGSYFSPTTNRKYYLDYAGKTYKGGIGVLHKSSL